jgi:hypothetical protein
MSCLRSNVVFPLARTFTSLGSIALLLACGAAEPTDEASANTTTGPQPTDALAPTGTEMAAATDGAAPAAAPSLPLPGGETGGFVESDEDLAAAGAPPPPVSEAVTECASADAPASLSKVVLAFVFDVSASMGSCEHYVSSTLGLFKGNYLPSEYFIHVQHFWSQHPGGAYVGMTDGSVRFLSYTIDYNTYIAASTRANGEIVGDL